MSWDGFEAPLKARLRLFVIGVLVFSLLCTLFGRLWYMQVMSSADYSQAANQQHIRQVLIPAPRGTIVDSQGRTLVGKIFRKLSQIIIGQIGEQIVHRRIFAPAGFEGFQLVVEISGRLARKPREIGVVRALPFNAMAGRAGLDALRHIGRIGSGFLGRGKTCAQEEKTACQEGLSYGHYVSPKHNHRTAKILLGGAQKGLKSASWRICLRSAPNK